MKENRSTPIPSHQAHQVTTELSDVEQILQAIREQKRIQEHEEDALQVGNSQDSHDGTKLRTETEQHGGAPYTLIEKQLAAIWKEFLGLGHISVDDNFFDLGGDSVQATQILSRVQDVFQVEFSLELLFTIDITITELARLIEQKQLEQANSEELASLLQEIDALNDDEVQVQLAQSGQYRQEEDLEGRL